MFVDRAEELLGLRLVRSGDLRSSFNLNASNAAGVSLEIHNPDEEDLRSFLTTFRKFISNDEPIFLDRVAKRLWQRIESDEIRAALASHRAAYEQSQRVGQMGVIVNSTTFKPSDTLDLVGGLVDAEWSVPSDVAGVESSQGGPALVPPARFVVQDVSVGGPLYLAIWEGDVGYGHDGLGGEAREMWFVPPGFDNSPIPISGTWKGLDGSWSSIGNLESAFWGA